MSSENSAAQVIKAEMASLALIALTVKLSLIETSFDDPLGAAFRATYSFRPSHLAQSFIALLLVNQGLKINQHRGSHDARKFSKLAKISIIPSELLPLLQIPGIHKEPN